MYITANDITETTNPGNNANYFISNYAIGSPYYRTVAGEFELSDSPYGTFDQGGNVWEWNETKVFSASRVLRGGPFFLGSRDLHASIRYYSGPPFESFDVGFRVASIPEPSSLLLGAMASLGLLRRDGRRVNHRWLTSPRPAASDFRRAMSSCQRV